MGREQLGQGILFGPVAVLECPPGGAGDQVEARYGAGAAPCTWSSTWERARTELHGVGEVGLVPRCRPLLDRGGENGDRLVEELDRFEQCVGKPGLEGLGPGQHAVLAQRVGDDELDRAPGTHQPRDQLVPPIRG